ncbi:uncharacterized protein [Eurosta solidaginis]|uniref:uncharacterized protein n=1 Tax=Eurosta solidaginis TaxID=178769 RepID=UPI003530FB4F
MVHSSRSVSKEDVSSLHIDSGISLSSPPAVGAECHDAEETLLTTKQKQTQRRFSIEKATKRARKSKTAAADATPRTKKQKVCNSANSANDESDSAVKEVDTVIVNLDSAAVEINSAYTAEQLANAEVDFEHESATNSAVTVIIVNPAAVESFSSKQLEDLQVQLPYAETVAIIDPIQIVDNSAIITTAISEQSISCADSAFSETEVTQSAIDSADITNAVLDTVSLTVPTALSLDVKRLRKSYVCHVCNKEFRGNNDLRRHLLIHSDERPYKCEQCGKCYRQAVNLRNHITAAHEGQRQFTCPQCPKMFALKERLRLHMRLHSGEKPYACTMCEKRFARGGQLQQHIISHHKGSTKQHVCDKCCTAFSTPSNLRAHMDHYCEICKEHFPNEPALRAHINELHYKLGQFDCEICKKTIEDDNLAKHMKAHTNVKTHVCEVCNLYFMQKSQYNVHMRMHTGERPYQCKICWQTYAHSSVLKLHIRKHTGEKPFQCLICEDVVAFSQLAHLKTHMKKIHRQINPYMCEGCQQFFKVKVELQAHMRQCDRCDVDVEQQNSKNNDMQTLSHLRFLMALLLKKISSQQKLKQLGYEKRLIDNVVVASLKLANRKACEDQELPAIERMRQNVEEFLNWIVPAKAMETFREEQQSVENILDTIVTMYMKHK